MYGKVYKIPRILVCFCVVRLSLGTRVIPELQYTTHMYLATIIDTYAVYPEINIVFYMYYCTMNTCYTIPSLYRPMPRVS